MRTLHRLARRRPPRRSRRRSSRPSGKRRSLMPQPSRCSPSASLRYRNAVTWPDVARRRDRDVDLGQAGDPQLLRGAHPERGAGDARLVDRRRDRRVVVGVVLPAPTARRSSSGCASRGRASRSPSPRRASASSVPSAARCSTSRLARRPARRRGATCPRSPRPRRAGPSGAAASPFSSWSNQASIRSAQSQRRVRALGVRVLVVPLPEQLVDADAVLAQRDRPRDRVRRAGRSSRSCPWTSSTLPR